MADGDYYATYAEVRGLLMNAGLGTAGDTMFDATAIELALAITTAYIHIYVYKNNTTTMLTGSYATICKGVQIDLVMQQILRARTMKENNLADFGSTIQFWTISPYLTREHKSMLDLITNAVDGVAFSFDVRTGVQI